MFVFIELLFSWGFEIILLEFVWLVVVAVLLVIWLMFVFCEFWLVVDLDLVVFFIGFDLIGWRVMFMVDFSFWIDEIFVGDICNYKENVLF